MNYPKTVRLVEVGPRDGLQNEAKPVSVEAKVTLIDALSAAGHSAVEAGSFVSPKWVPQMANTDEVMARIQRKAGVSYPVLVPNKQGMNGAVEAKVGEIAIFTAASEAFCRKNTNCSIDESFERFAPVMEAAQKHGMKVRGYVSTVIACPYDGKVSPAKVAEVSDRLFRMGCYEVSLGDTIGVGTPGDCVAMIDAVAEKMPREKIAAHFHDTYGQSLANILAVMERGIAVFDTAVAGLGGCPYAKGASGNVGTEDVIYLMNGLGIQHGVDLEAIAKAGREICTALGREPASKVAQALKAKSSGVMNVLVDGQAHAALSPQEEKDVRQFRAEESVQGTVLPAEEATAAYGGQLRLVFMILWGVVALVAVVIASLAAPADMPIVFPVTVFVIVALGAFFAFVSWRRTRALRQELPRRLEGLAPAGTVIGVDAAGLTVTGTTLPWSTLAIEQVEFRRYSTRHAVIFTLERLVLRGPAGLVVLDPILIGNGHLLVGNTWRRMRAAA